MFFEESEDDTDTMNDDLFDIPEDPKSEQTDRWLQNLDTSDQAEYHSQEPKTGLKASVRQTATNGVLNANGVPQKSKSLRFCRHEDTEHPTSGNIHEPIGEPTVSLSDFINLLAKTAGIRPRKEVG